jgi:hypothetical protein
MVHTRAAHKFDRVTITLVPSADERILIQVPSTFNKTERIYGWRRSESMQYMIVPTRISNSEVKLDIFVHPLKGGKQQSKSIQKTVQEFVEGKIESEWQGMKLIGISRPTAATPPKKSFVRGTIEEMLGANLDN